jgi:hypothetical protein
MEPLAHVMIAYEHVMTSGAVSASNTPSARDRHLIIDQHRRPGLLTRRPRALLAEALHRTADAVAPAPSTPACSAR